MLQAEEAHPAFLTRLRRKPRDSQPLPAMPDHQQGCPRVAPGQPPHREHHQPGAAEHLSPCVRIGNKGPGSRPVAEKGESCFVLTLPVCLIPPKTLRRYDAARDESLSSAPVNPDRHLPENPHCR
jgi:hypothetical protein